MQKPSTDARVVALEEVVSELLSRVKELEEKEAKERQAELLTIQEVADKVGVCRMTVYRAIKFGHLKSTTLLCGARPHRGAVRVRIKDMQEWACSHSNELRKNHKRKRATA